MPPVSKTIHVILNGNVQGPFSREEVFAMIQQGQLLPESPAWREGLADWKRLDQLVELPTAQRLQTPAAALQTIQQQSSPQDIYVHRGDETTGPFSEGQIQMMLNSGMIDPTDVAWREGLASWLPLHQLVNTGSALPVSSQRSDSFPAATPALESKAVPKPVQAEKHKTSFFDFLFKARDDGIQANELDDYCEKHRLPGFGLLAEIATFSTGIAQLNDTGCNEDLFDECFAYLLGKASWIAETNHRFSEREYQFLFGNLRHIDDTGFSKGGASRNALARIQRFFARQLDSSGSPVNQMRVSKYCGNFVTDIDRERFNAMVVSALGETGWNGSQWQNYPLSQLQLAKVVGEAFNMTQSLPSSLYEKSDYRPALEAIYDLAFMALMRENHFKEDSRWWLSVSGGLFLHTLNLLRGASSIVREVVVTTSFPGGLRS